MPTKPLTLEVFTPHLGAAFSLVPYGAEDAEPVSLTLACAEASRHTAGGRAAFSLVFVGEPTLDQAIHTVVHPELGPLGIFLVPIGPGPQGLQYEAVFN